MKKKKMLLGAALTSAFSFGCKGSGMLFRVYLASRMGADGMGMYQLIMSVYALFTSLASAGFTVCVSRLAAEDYQIDGAEGAAATARTAMRIALFSGLFSAFLLFASAFPVSSLISGSGKTAGAFRILAVSMPFIALSSCLKGYFLASRRSLVPASAQLFEELCKIGIIFAVLTFVLYDTVESGALCAGIAFGLSAGEMLSFAYLRLFFAGGAPRRAKAGGRNRRASSVVRALLPVAASNWLTSALHAAENVLIPFCFSMYSGEGGALAEFGVIRGMAIPVLFFPFAFVSALISILTPEISRLNVADIPARDSAVGKVLRLTSVISVAAGALMFFYADEISVCFYRTSQAAHAVRMLSAVTPFMYIETVSDGILKGIGKQSFCMRVTLANCVLRVAAMLAVIPRTGAEGYLWLLIVSNTFSCLMCAGRLIGICRVRGIVSHFAFPCAAAAVAGAVSRAAARAAAGISRDPAGLCAGGAVMLCLFALLCLPLLLINANRKCV